ncbi:MAG TPA: DNA/RNA non-specific endonuclease [Bacteroidetes bacterium]|nr:DNA/RNA non-specific endonuclease [Bacteroidota bacterium]
MKQYFWLLFFFPSLALAQGSDAELKQLEGELESLKQKQIVVLSKIEGVKLHQLQAALKKNGLPALQANEKLIEHQAMSLVYSEAHEQARWVAHIIMPDMVDGKVSRSNDFRIDPLISTGSTEEKDFFLTKIKEDGSTEWDGFGYDRGHLAPSADFRWSSIALSESFFYSNMSPQRPDFNRGIWAELEGKIRAYIFDHPGIMLYVVTGPVLEADLPKVTRSINKPSIPKQYFKVVMDLKNQRGIGFILPNQAVFDPIGSFAVPIDEVEALTHLDFFVNVPDVIEDGLERKFEAEEWLGKGSDNDVKALSPTQLPRNHFNTKQAKLYMNRNDRVSICGTVVGARTSRAGNVLLNLDKQYPNQVFTVFIRKENLSNFSYDPEKEWKGKAIAVTGKVANLGGTPAMFIKHEKELEALR